MTKQIVVGLLSVLFTTAMTGLLAQSKQEIRTAVLKVSGFHCQGCCAAVEEGLRQLDGVQDAKADFKTSTVVVKCDESLTPVSRVTLAVADVPHMMGKQSGMRYTARLMLTLQKGDARKVAKALAKLKGVQKVEQEKNTLLITFKRDANVRYADLEETVRKAGGTLAPVKTASASSRQTTLQRGDACCQLGK